MASQEPEDQPWDSNSRRQAAKRKRETPAQRLAANKASRSNTPNAFARRSPPRNAPPPRDDDGDRSPPRKRPGARAAVGRGQAGQMQRQMEEQQRKDVISNQATGAELVAQHYNAVPERGREWRSTESKIKGLRSLNNWIKSTLIQKFSRPEIPVEHMTVLDMACGKGGDLGKWEKAPQTPSLYVGCDIADVSIDQARSRYNENMRRGGRNRRAPPMEAQFYVQDTFGTSLGDIPIVRQVGFDPNAGPGPQVVQGRMFSGGFDVVSMMFALHYSFESEALARAGRFPPEGNAAPDGAIEAARSARTQSDAVLFDFLKLAVDLRERLLERLHEIFDGLLTAVEIHPGRVLEFRQRGLCEIEKGLIVLAERV